MASRSPARFGSAQAPGVRFVRADGAEYAPPAAVVYTPSDPPAFLQVRARGGSMRRRPVHYAAGTASAVPVIPALLSAMGGPPPGTALNARDRAHPRPPSGAA